MSSNHASIPVQQASPCRRFRATDESIAVVHNPFHLSIVHLQLCSGHTVPRLRRCHCTYVQIRQEE